MNNEPAAKSLVQFVPAKGSVVGGRSVSRDRRIQGAIADLELAISGCAAQQSDDPNRQALVFHAFAKACSLFLRNMAIDRQTRLLDGDTCRAIDLKLGRVRRVRDDRKALTLTCFDLLGGKFIVDKLVDERPWEIEATQDISIPRQRLEFRIEWPLPGMADWVHQPSYESPWVIGMYGLFRDPQPSPILNCDEWLGQQLILFDDQPISLRQVIKVTADTEAAHSVDASRLMQVEGERDRRTVQNRNIHILSGLTMCGIQYNHAIVVEAAMHLYLMLHRAGLAGEPGVGVDIPTFGLLPPGDPDVFASNQTWLRFSGGLVLSLGGAPQIISHRIRAPGGNKRLRKTPMG